MELGQIEAFVAVAREGSFTKAANYLNISQPSLSNRIYRLEQSLNGNLVDRGSRPVTLTPQGKTFLSYAERALAILTAAEEVVRDQYLDGSLELKVGCPFSVATYLIPELVDQFSRSFPHAELFIETGNSDFVIDQLADGLVNLAFAAAFPKFIGETQMLLLLHDEMTVAVPSDHPLTLRQDLAVADLWHYRVLLIHWGPTFYAYIESLRQMSHTPGPLMRLPLAGALPMARKADTVTFMPRRLVKPSGLIEVQVRDFSFAWDIALMTRPGRTLAPLEDAFLNIVSGIWKTSEPSSTSVTTDRSLKFTPGTD